MEKRNNIIIGVLVLLSALIIINQVKSNEPENSVDEMESWLKDLSGNSILSGKSIFDGRFFRFPIKTEPIDQTCSIKKQTFCNDMKISLSKSKVDASLKQKISKYCSIP